MYNVSFIRKECVQDNFQQIKYYKSLYGDGAIHSANNDQGGNQKHVINFSWPNNHLNNEVYISLVTSHRSQCK